MLMIPLRSNEFDDRVLRLLQAVTRFTNDQLMNLRHIGRGQVTFFATLFGRPPDHASQRRLDVQQRAGNIHQHSVIRRAQPLADGLDQGDLIENDLARLCETENGQGIGDLLERHLEAGEIGDDLAITAHEQVEAVLDPYQLFAEGRDHRAHCTAVGTGKLGPLLIDDSAVRQRFIQTVMLLECLNARRLPRCLGNVEKQVLDQLVRSSLIETIGTLLNQPL